MPRPRLAAVRRHGIDMDRASALILDEFRAGKVGKITIEPLNAKPARGRRRLTICRPPKPKRVRGRRRSRSCCG